MNYMNSSGTVSHGSAHMVCHHTLIPPPYSCTGVWYCRCCSRWAQTNDLRSWVLLQLQHKELFLSNLARASPSVTVASALPRVSSVAESLASGSGGATALPLGQSEWKVVKHTAERVAMLSFSEAVARPPLIPLSCRIWSWRASAEGSCLGAPQDDPLQTAKVSDGLKCDTKLQEVSRDTTGTSPMGSPALSLGYAVTCFMLKDADSKSPRLPYDTA